MGVAAAGLAVAQAWLLARAISGAYLGGEGLSELAPVLGGLGFVLLARPLLAWIGDIAAHRISATVKARLREDLLAAAVRMGPRWAAETPSSSVVLLATRGLDALDGFYGRYLPQAVLAVLVPLAVIVCLGFVDGVAAITVALTVPLVPVFMVLVGRMSAAHRARRWALLGRLARRFGDVVAGLTTLRIFGAAEAQVGVLRRITDTYRSTTMATLRVAFLSALVLELLATISVALVAVGIGLRLAVGELTLDVGLFALVLAPEAYLPLRRLGAEFHASEEGVTAAAEAFAIIEAHPSVGGAEAGRPMPMPKPMPARIRALVIDGVSVSQPGRGVLAPAGASLVLRPGEVVAVTGPSGCGKSTLLGVILGLVEPSVGRVLLEAGATSGGAADADAVGADGVDVRELDAEAWRGAVAWVPQAPYLLPGTVAENVRLGARTPVADADVVVALDAAGLGEDAGVGPSREVGEGGRGLSGGERRRVGVARALVRRAPLLLLDEPTAGLDAAAEAAVTRAIRSAADAGAMVLLVAHRPGAIAGADRCVEIRWAEVAP